MTCLLQFSGRFQALHCLGLERRAITGMSAVPHLSGQRMKLLLYAFEELPGWAERRAVSKWAANTQTFTLS